MHLPIPVPPFVLGLSTAFIFCGILLMTRRRIKDNPRFGVCTPVAPGSTEAEWLAANRRRARVFIAVGLLLVPGAYAVGLIHL